MATVGHLAVGAALARLFADPHETRAAARRRMACAAWIAVAPDADLLLRTAGVGPSDEPIAHRGASHALVVGPLLFVVGRTLGLSRRDALCYSAAIASHGLTDLLSSDERGVALLWPITPQRYALGWNLVSSRTVELLGTGWRPFLGVIAREIAVFAPVWVLALWPRRRSAS